MEASSVPSPGAIWPVSVKGVVLCDGRVLLARNHRQEWELPGGRLEAGKHLAVQDERPEECVAREIKEETGWQVKARGRPLDAYVFRPLPDRRVLILTYGCVPITTGALMASREHLEVALIPLAELGGLWLPEGYRHSIVHWASLRGEV